MADISTKLVSFALVFAATGLVHCGGSSSTTSGDGGTTNDSGSPPPGSPPSAHRSTPSSCSLDRAPGQNPDGGTDAGGVPGSCASDTQCTAGRNGRCTLAGQIGYACSYDTCFVDGDCAGGTSGTVCQCGASANATRSGANACVAGNCRVDADCGAGGFCSPTLDEGCARANVVVGYYCHTAQDACKNDSDCAAAPGSNMMGGQCTYHKATGAWACSYGICAG